MNNPKLSQVQKSFKMSTEPQSCTKCGSLPEDILMLACSHDLCLDCAADRLAVESKKKTATGIVCEFCNQRTQLDAESIYELEKIMLDLQSRRNKRDLKQATPVARPDSQARKVDKYDRPTRQKRSQYENKSYGEFSTSKQPMLKVPLSPSPYTQSRRNCAEHPEQQLMYYCFECNCECICPECVIHGKHKNHDVKTLRKSQPVIKGRLENLLENIDNNIDGLTLKKSEFEKHIKDVSEFNNNSKKQIQRVFNDLRQRIANKENEILAKCDKALEMTVEEFEAGIKAIVRKIDDIKQSSQSIVDVLKRDELTLLNFYARRNQGLQELVKKIDLGIFVRQDADKILSNESTLKFVSEMSDQIGDLDIDSSIKYDPKYDQPRTAPKFAQRDYQPQQQYKRPTREVDKSREYTRKY